MEIFSVNMGAELLKLIQCIFYGICVICVTSQNLRLCRT